MCGSHETKSRISPQKKKDTTLQLLPSVVNNDTNQVVSKSLLGKCHFCPFFPWRSSILRNFMLICYVWPFSSQLQVLEKRKHQLRNFSFFYSLFAWLCRTAKVWSGVAFSKRLLLPAPTIGVCDNLWSSDFLVQVRSDRPRQKYRKPLWRKFATWKRLHCKAFTWEWSLDWIQWQGEWGTLGLGCSNNKYLH